MIMSNTITGIILTYNEEIHIERCINSLKKINSKILVVDSYSTDNTVRIAQKLGATVVQHNFINHASQINWAVQELGIDNEWIMRLDADEYLESDLQTELISLLPIIPNNVDGLYINRKVFFYGKWIRYGGFYPHTLMRIWRNGKGKVEQRWMDEHVVLKPDSQTITVKGHLVDDNHKGITFWIDKHNRYASREAVELLNLKYPLFHKDLSLTSFDDPQAKGKRKLKENIYAKLPIGIRSLMYFVYRYIVKAGFLDGIRGLLWHFLQGFWYRLLVDIKIKEIEDRSGGDVEKMKQIILKDHGIDLYQ
jgi:glycosyltransferase involved in cell wall biosynthesis